jgi:hypothetical protein
MDGASSQPAYRPDALALVLPTLFCLLFFALVNHWLSPGTKNVSTAMAMMNSEAFEASHLLSRIIGCISLFFLFCFAKVQLFLLLYALSATFLLQHAVYRGLFVTLQLKH